MQKKQKTNPVDIIINFDKPVQKFKKGLIANINFIIKSTPPKKIIKPNKTTICINIFCFFGIMMERKENSKTGIPKIVGIKEVIDSDSLNKLTKKPQIIKKNPYANPILGILRFKTKNSFSLSLINLSLQ